MITESIAISKVMDYLTSKGWQVRTNVKLRGRVSDFVAIRDGKISVIEVKAGIPARNNVKFGKFDLPVKIAFAENDILRILLLVDGPGFNESRMNGTDFTKSFGRFVKTAILH